MKERIKKVQDLLKEKAFDVLYLENSMDLTYLTGLHLSAGRLIITPKTAYLLVDGRYFEKAKAHTQLQESLEVWLDTPEKLREILHYSKIVKFDGSTLPWEIVEKYIKEFPLLNFSSFPSPLKELRAEKEDEEIAKMKQAASLGAEGYDFLLSQLKEGVTEKELAQKLLIFWLNKGAQGVAFEPIIAFGAHSALPHHRASPTPLKKGDTVLLDTGVILDSYHSDMTRTVFFGQPSPQMKEIYEIVKAAHSKSASLLKASAKPSLLDVAAREVIAAQGYSDNYTHGLGHGIGLEIHEWPYLKNREPYLHDELKASMFVTIEPGIYLPGLGGVRIEDTYLVLSDGAESITQRSHEIQVIPYV